MAVSAVFWTIKEQTYHWQMVGEASSPIASFEDVNFTGIDGLVGFFTDNLLACELIGAAGHLGIRIPQAVAVLGVDNNHWLTQLAHPPMSSIEPDWRQIGYRAASLLNRLMLGEPAPSPSWIPPLFVDARASTDILLSEDPLVAQALQCIRDHCLEDISVEFVRQELGISRRKLEMRMRHATGQSPYRAICRARMEKAKRRLIQTDDTLAKIAKDCGVAQNQFYILFKRFTGMTPGQYRSRFSTQHTFPNSAL